MTRIEHSAYTRACQTLSPSLVSRCPRAARSHASAGPSVFVPSAARGLIEGAL